MISACFDDSQIDPRLCIVAGLAGYDNQWEFFERLWRAVLARHGLPYLHMREMALPTGEFAKWHPPEKHEAEVTAFLNEAVGALRDPYLHPCGAVVHLQDLERFNADKGLDLKPYSLAVYGCMTQLAQQYPGLPVTSVFDRAEHIDDRLTTARAYADSVDPELSRLIKNMARPTDTTFRSVPPLQAADLVVWEQRRARSSMERGRTPEPAQKMLDQQWDEFRVWSRINREYPLQRKSFDALIEAGLAVNLIVWDYDQLSRHHEARGGVWAPAR